MRVTLVILMLVSAAGSPAADLRVNVYDAELNYWMGRAYQGRGDIATPFGGGYNSKALVYLRKAVALAPGSRRISPRTV